MATPATTTPPTPGPIFHTMVAFQDSQALKVAMALDIFTGIGIDSGDAYTFSQYEKMFGNAG